MNNVIMAKGKAIPTFGMAFLILKGEVRMERGQLQEIAELNKDRFTVPKEYSHFPHDLKRV